MTRRRDESNSKIRFYAKMTGAGSDPGNTLKSGYPKKVGDDKLILARLGAHSRLFA